MHIYIIYINCNKNFIYQSVDQPISRVYQLIANGSPMDRWIAVGSPGSYFSPYACQANFLNQMSVLQIFGADSLQTRKYSIIDKQALFAHVC